MQSGRDPKRQLLLVADLVVWIDTMDTKSLAQALETFVIDNAQLEDLESRIAEFNIFEAIGAVRNELRHSDFLAFLLNPSEKHGLGDLFLKRFLMRVLSVADDPPVSPVTIDVVDLSGAVVERESQNIDILIHDASSGLVCVIENKVFSGEHSDQLNRYWRIVRQRFPTAQIIPVFLTPEGIPPANEDSRYIPFGYAELSALMDRVRQSQESMLGADVNTMIRHYVTMLGRHIVTESEIAELCRQIYRTHKAAIDLIIEHMPDVQQELGEYLEGLVSSTRGLTVVRYAKSYVNFVPQEWQARPQFNAGVGWGDSRSTMTFEFRNGPDHLSLHLVIGPVQQTDEHVRAAIFAYADSHRNVFTGCRRNLTPNWATIYKLRILSKHDYEDASAKDLAEIVESKWQHFIDHILPPMNDHLMQIGFEPPSLTSEEPDRRTLSTD